MEAMALLEQVPAVHVAGVGPEGPVLRTLHHALSDGLIVFHGADRGGKLDLIGEVVLQGEVALARIPSWMTDPERACPATTWFRSVQVRGTCARLEDPGARARALQALMERLQPEGGYVPITAEDPRYARTVASLAILAVTPREVTVRNKVGQNRGPETIGRVARALWERGDPGDLAMIEILRREHPARPVFAPIPGAIPRCHPEPEDLERVADLLTGTYWNLDRTRDQLVAVHRSSDVWVGLEVDGRLVASARGVSDRARRSWLYDVVVDPAMRGRGLGSALIRLFLDHPRVRRTEVWLGTRDAMPFYERLGFGVRSPSGTPMWRGPG